MASPKARWRLLLIAAVCLVTAILVSYQVIDSRRRHARERTALRNLVGAGIPANADELNAFCQLPDDVRDETELWTAIFDLTREIDSQLFERVGVGAADGLPIVWENDQGYTIPPPGVDWDRSDQCTDYLDQFGEVFPQSRLLRENTGAIHSPVDFDLDDDEFHSFVDGYRNLSELLLLDSHQQARLGNSDIALANLQAVFAMIHAGRFEAEYNGVMALQTAHLLASITAIRLASQCSWSDNDLSELQAVIARPDFRRYTQRSYKGDAGVLLNALTLDGNGIESRLIQDNRIVVAEQLLPIIQGFDQPWPAVFDSQDRYYECLNELYSDPVSKKWYTPFLACAPATGHQFRITANAVTAQRAAVIAIAFQRQKQMSNAMPASIEGLNSDFLPETPPGSDPFTGQPLNAISRNVGIVIYGAGRNRQDDGGEVKPTDEFEDPKDIGVILGWTNSSSLPE